jgi:U3 small nucleolar RNA-associated protein 11
MKRKDKDVGDNIQEPEEELGWKSNEPKRKSKKRKSLDTEKEEDEGQKDSHQHHLDNRKRLLSELSARLDRDRKLRYAQREFEMQRLMMGKGARRKIKGVEKVEGDEDDEEDEDEIDARRGKRRSLPRQIDEEAYRPRVYKWRLERKK